MLQKRTQNVGANELKKIIACVDQSSYVDSVAAYAAWAAERLQSPLELLHVIDRELHTSEGKDHSGTIGVNAREQLLQHLSLADESKSKVARENARAFITNLRQRLQNQYPDLQLDTRLRIDNLSTALAEHEAEAQMFVLGRRGSSGDEQARTAASSTVRLGGQLEDTVRALHQPVLAVGTAFVPPKKVLIAYDGGAMAKKAVDTVAKSPLFANLQVHVLHANDSGKPAKLEGVGQSLERAGVQAVVEEVTGKPVESVAHYIDRNNIDLLVMGAYSRSPWRSLFTGSKTNDVLQVVQVPTLLLR